MQIFHTLSSLSLGLFLSNLLFFNHIPIYHIFFSFPSHSLSFALFLSECDWSCNSCRGPLRSDCLQCMEGYVLQDGICVPGCSPGFYQHAERCLSQSSTKITTFIMSPTNQFSSSINFDISISQSVVTVGEGGRATNVSCIVPTSAAVLEPRFNGTLMD